MAYQSVTVEGGIFPPDLLERIAEGVDGGMVGQRSADFWLSEGRRLADELQSAFSDVRTEWEAFQGRLRRSNQSRTTLTREWMAHFFEVLGHRRLVYQQAAVEAGGERYVISHLHGEGEAAPPIHIGSLDHPLDQRDGRRSPHSTVQEYLNRSDSLWAMVTNGRRIRLLRDSERFTRPSYVEFDIEGIIEGNQYPEFVLLYRLLHASRFPSGDAAAHECLLETYYTQGIEHGGRVRERLRDGVETALLELGQAFVSHPESEALREAFRQGQIDSDEFYRKLLRLVYRLLFLMVAEERRLIFPEGANDERVAVYERYYSVSALRNRVEGYSGRDQNQDLWLGLVQTFRLFRDDATASKLSLSALDGELFGPLACRHLEHALCTNEALLRALWGLSLFRDESKALRRVNYAAINVEEFGSIYESLLDFQPRVDLTPEPRFDLLAGTERKQTGSYYTPPELVQELINSALVPVMSERLEAARTPEAKAQALLDLRVIDPASGSGHFVLAAARRIATELVRVRSGEDEPSPRAFREAMRDVTRHCIYAVDKNPLAVDLCKVALWIEGHAPGLPLSFLDHHVKCGDSLVGVFDLKVLEEGIPDAAYTAVTGDDKSVATAYRKRNREERKQAVQGFQIGFGETTVAHPESLADDFAALGELEERTPEDVQAKERLYQALREGPVAWSYRVTCDLWTYAYFAPLRSGAELIPTTRTIQRARREPNALDGRLVGEAQSESVRLRFFHWPLEFPDVLIRHGGFDVVLGNPPWELLQPEETKFFAAAGAHHIAGLAGAQRKQVISRLDQEDPLLAAAWRTHQREIQCVAGFARDSGRFPDSAVGKLNTYAVFAELSRRLLNRNGRAGVIVPTGIATDDTTKRLFGSFVDGRFIASLYDFENREGVFPGVHRSYKFCLLTLTGDGFPVERGWFAFYLTAPEQLRHEGRVFTLTREDFELFNPNTRTCPVFRTRRDYEVARKLYERAGVFVREARDGLAEENPWGVSFQQMINMTSDSGLFRTAEELHTSGFTLDGNVFRNVTGREYLPLYEAKLFHQYDHRFATFDGAADADRKGGNAREVAIDEKVDPKTVVMPRYWVPAEEVAARVGPVASDITGGGGGIRAPRSWQLAFRDIARATDERTGIFTVIPLVGLGHTAALVHPLAVGSLVTGTSSVGPISGRPSPQQLHSEPWRRTP